MATVPPRSPNRTGAVASTRKRRPPIWLWLLLLLLALLLLAWLLYAVFHKTHHKKAGTTAPIVSTAPSTAGTPSPSSPSTAPSVPPSAATSTAVTTAPSAAASYGAALAGGGTVAAHPATGTEAAAASSATGSSTVTGSAAAGPQGTVLFASNSAVIDSAGLQVIEAAAVRIKALHPSAVTVTGYTDVVGGQPKNDTLSQQRANAVAAVLRKDLGASPTVTATAKGESDPIAPNTTPAGRQQNRRAVITGS